MLTLRHWGESWNSHPPETGSTPEESPSFAPVQPPFMGSIPTVMLTEARKGNEDKNLPRMRTVFTLEAEKQFEPRIKVGQILSISSISDGLFSALQ